MVAHICIEYMRINIVKYFHFYLVLLANTAAHGRSNVAAAL